MSDSMRQHIKNQYPHFTDAQLDVISEQAYVNGHAGGQEEADNAALDLADFAHRFLVV